LPLGFTGLKDLERNGRITERRVLEKELVMINISVEDICANFEYDLRKMIVNIGIVDE
jgi:hypothetical protein